MQEVHLNILTAQLKQSQSIEIKVENEVFEEPKNHIDSVIQNKDEVKEYETAITNDNCIERNNESKLKKSNTLKSNFVPFHSKIIFVFR